MKQKKSIQDLTIKDNFMFGAVMLNPENCRGTLERALGMKIGRVEVSKEKSIVYNPEYKGVRLDIYAKDAEQTHYNIEMQVLSQAFLGKRARYYHDQIDMELLFSGLSYSELPDTYVIFICDFDPYGEGKYRYTLNKVCSEMPGISMEDGAHTIYLSTKGTNDDEVPKELVKFLKFVGAPLSESEKDYDDEFVRKLQNSIGEVKVSREMGARYMTFQELLNDERAEGRAEGRVEGSIMRLSDQVQKKLAKNKSIDLIAEELEEDVNIIADIVAKLKE